MSAVSKLCALGGQMVVGLEFGTVWVCGFHSAPVYDSAGVRGQEESASIVAAGSGQSGDAQFIDDIHHERMWAKG